MVKAVHYPHTVMVDLPLELRDAHRKWARQRTKGDESPAFRAMLDAIDLDETPIPQAVVVEDESTRLAVQVNDEQLEKLDELTRRWSGNNRMDAMRRLISHFAQEVDYASE